MLRSTTSRSAAVVRQGTAALRVLLLLTVLLGVAYPGAVWAVGQAGLRDQAEGSLVRVDGRVVGSSLLGQRWTGAQWFHSRPSASDHAGDTSGGSNLPASSPDLQADVAQRRAALGGAATPDLLTASGSGLDPHITPEAADGQVARVATARGLPRTQVAALVRQQTQHPTLGFLGQPRVNVLQLNLALARVAARG